MENKHVNKARSKDNGIVFYSNTFPSIGVESVRKEDGRTYVRIIFNMIQYDYLDKQAAKKEKRFFDKTKIYIINLLLISSAYLVKDIFYCLAVCFFVCYVSEHFLKLCECIFKTKRGKMYNKGKMHSAEHQGIKAYEKFQRVPTLEEVRNMSRFASKCDSRIFFREICVKLMLNVIIILGSKLELITIIILLAITTLMWTLGTYLDVFKYLQVLITNPATDEELQVVVEGLKEFDKLEKRLNSDEGALFMTKVQSVFCLQEITPEGNFENSSTKS